MDLKYHSKKWLQDHTVVEFRPNTPTRELTLPMKSNTNMPFYIARAITEGKIQPTKLRESNSRYRIA